MEPRGKRCPGIEGLIEEAKEIIEEAEEPDALDAGLLAAAQSVEHYEISRYGTLVAWAEELGMNDAVPLLRETLQEEKNADRLLSQLAEGKLNREAA
jgi:ferritin-like metal-binding protein YciE